MRRGGGWWGGWSLHRWACVNFRGRWKVISLLWHTNHTLPYVHEKIKQFAVAAWSSPVIPNIQTHACIYVILHKIVKNLNGGVSVKNRWHFEVCEVSMRCQTKLLSLSYKERAASKATNNDKNKCYAIFNSHSWWMTNMMHKSFSMYLFPFITLYMFRAYRAHHQGRQIDSIQPLVTVILCWWPRCVQVGRSSSNLHTSRPLT